jgi:hypothetical protein
MGILEEEVPLYPNLIKTIQYPHNGAIYLPQPPVIE